MMSWKFQAFCDVKTAKYFCKSNELEAILSLGWLFCHNVKHSVTERFLLI